MQFTLTTLALALAASAVAMPANPASMERRQSGNVNLGGVCSSRNDCIGQLNCISAGGNQICSRNLGVGQPCAQNADCGTNNCGAGDNGNQGVVGFECLP